MAELGYAVFLVNEGAEVTMEPMAPLAGPDLRVGKEKKEYFVEIRRVRLDEAHAAADLATEDVFEKLCKTPSRHSVVISMTDEYAAHSPELKKAVRLVRGILEKLEAKGVEKATLYYHGPNDYSVREGIETQAAYDYSDGKRLRDQVRDEEWKRKAGFVARFDDTGRKNDRTGVGVLALGEDRIKIKPDEAYLRLRTLLRKKQKQLPKSAPGIIVLDISDLGKLLVDEFTIARTLYGDLVVVLGAAAEGYPHDLQRKPNGYFMKTTRVSAVVIQETTSLGGRRTDQATSVSHKQSERSSPDAR